MAKNLILWLVIAAVLLTVFNSFKVDTTPNTTNHSQFVHEVQQKKVKKVVIDGYDIFGERVDGSRFQSIRPAADEPRLMDDLLSNNALLEVKKPQGQSIWRRL